MTISPLSNLEGGSTDNALFLTPGWRSLSLHAEKVSYVYQSENKHENYENHLIHRFVNLSIGKQNIKNFEEYHFLIQKVERLRP